MDILHEVNLHIFVEFQDYIAHTYGENAFGSSIYDITQATIEDVVKREDPSLAQTEAYSLWMCFRSAWISGGSKPPEGHDEPCYYCDKACNSLAGNPSEWPIPLCHNDDPGKVKWHHIGCVDEKLWQLEQLKKMIDPIALATMLYNNKI